MSTTVDSVGASVHAAAARPTSTLEILKAARELISDPARWTQKDYARDTKGNSMYGERADAVCWCSVGALQHVIGRSFGLDLGQAEVALDMGCGENALSFNDTHSHAEVLAAWDRAIAKLEAQ